MLPDPMTATFVLGDTREALDDVTPAEVEMQLHRDGELVSQGTGRDCLGDPLNAAAWLARTARDLGDPLRAGEVVLSGALGRMVAVGPGARVHAEISSLGPVSATFAGKENA